MRRMEGKYIVIEGIDGSGTTTQVELLRKWLNDRRKDVLLTHEPLKENGRIGKIIRERLIQDRENYSPETIALAFAADRLDHIEDIVKPALDEDKYVISDRYYYSSLVYQPSHGANFDWVKKINKYALEPNLSIILDVEVEEAMKRLKKRDGKSNIIFEKKEFQRKTKKRYLELKDELNEEICILNGNRKREEIQRDIRDKVEGKLLNS